MDVVHKPFLILCLILYVTSVSALSILPSETYVLGKAFTVTCGADANGVTKEAQVIKSASLFRNTHRPVKNVSIAAVSAKLFAEGADWKRVFQSIPHGKELEIQFPSKDEMLKFSFKRETVVVKANFKAPNCSDAGVYICIVWYHLNGIHTAATKTKNLAIQGCNWEITPPKNRRFLGTSG